MRTSGSSAVLTTEALDRRLQTEAFGPARVQWRGEAAPRKVSATNYAIAISRESGAGGTAVADELGRLLKWPVYDRELLEHIADDAGLRAQLLESLDEKRPPCTTDVWRWLSGGEGMPGASQAKHLAQTVLALAANGHCVIVGRGSAVLAPPKTSLRVRLVASLDDRTERVRKRLSLSTVDAIERVRFTDERRERFVKDYFHQAASDAHNYDLIVNTSRFSLTEAALLIIDALDLRRRAANQ